MNTLELKNTLHRLIDQVDDDSILQAHLTLLSREITQPTTDFWDDLSPANKASIDRGLADLAAGRRVPFNDILERYRP